MKPKSFALVILAIVVCVQTYASVLEKRISINFVNTPLLDALTNIEKQANITFSFKSDDISQKKRTTIRATNATIDDILKQILAGQNVSYKAIGSQIILYKTIRSTGNNTPVPGDVVSDTIRVTVFDTVKTYDTIRMVKHDTVRVKVYDTIRTMIPISPTNKVHGSQGTFITLELLYSYSLGFTDLQPNTNLQHFSETNPRCNDVLFTVGMQHGRWNISTGVGYREEQKHYEYSNTSVNETSNTISKVEYYDVFDSTYFVIQPLDTTWFVDKTTKEREVQETIVNKDSSTETYTGKQMFRGIQVPVCVSFTLIDRGKWNIFLSSSLIFGFVRANDATFYDTGKKTFVQSKDIAIAPVSCKFVGSLGVGYEVFKQFYVTVSPSFSYQISKTFVTGNLMSNKPMQVGMQVGMKKNITFQ